MSVGSGRRHNSARHGTILLAVVLLVAGCALVAGIVSARATPVVDGAMHLRERAQARAAAWSGVLALMSELQQQRETLLAGGEPEVSTRWTLGRGGDRPGAGVDGAWVVELVEVESWGGTLARGASTGRADAGAAEGGMMGAVLTSEAARAPLGRVTPAELERIEGATGEWARAVGTGPRPPGAGVEDVIAGVAGTPSGAAGLLTTLSADPELRAGVTGEDTGEARIVLAGEVSDAEASELDQLLGRPGLGRRLVEQVRGAGASTGRGAVVGFMRRNGVETARWAGVLDAVAPGPDPYTPGMVDVTRASEDVLAMLPGFSRETARAAVQRRATLSSQERRGLGWLLQPGLLSPEAFESAADWLTVRSLQHRARVRAGLQRGGDAGVRGDEGALSHAVTLEVVIDVAGDVARVAWLRDVTTEASVELVSSVVRLDAPAEGGAEETQPPIEAPAPGGASSGPTGPTRDAPAGNDRAGVSPGPGDGEVATGPAPRASEPVAGMDRRGGRWAVPTDRRGGAR